MPTKESIILSSKTFAEFKKNLAHLSTKEKGDAFELLTKLFLMIEPKYSTTLESVYLYSEIPSSVQQKLNLPLKDHGINIGQSNANIEKMRTLS
jgi:predicted helicase